MTLSGCTTTTETTQIIHPDIFTLIDSKQFGVKPDIITPSAIFELEQSSQQDFLNYYHAAEHATIGPHHRIYNYIEKRIANYNYYGQTHTAQQTIESNSGNCISLAILVSAYANLVNVPVKYSAITTAPVYLKDKNFQLISNHVRTKLEDPTYIKPENKISFGKPGIVIDYFPSRNNWSAGVINEQQFIAMYYRNLAANALQKQQINLAAWYIVEALKLAPNELSAINILAVIYRHLALPEQAEKIYLHGLSYQQDNLNLLSNYHLLLQQLNRTEDANIIQQKINNADDPSPFRWLSLADEYFKKQQNRLALRYYNKVIEKAPYLHHGYAGAAKALFLLDKKSESKAMMTIALAKTHEAKQEKLYKAKLAKLELSQ